METPGKIVWEKVQEHILNLYMFRVGTIVWEKVQEHILNLYMFRVI